MNAYDAAHTGLARCDGGDRAWIELQGADAGGFLQRVLSSDVARVQDGGGQWSAWLDGKGRWIADVLLFRLEERYALDLPVERAERILEMLQLFHFGEKMEWRLLHAPRLLLLGPQAAAAAAAAGLEAPAAPPGSVEAEQGEFALARRGGLQVLRRPDRGAPCVELIGTGAAELRARLPGVDGDAATLERLRIEAFQPRYGPDFDENSSLPESSEWRRASVRKGCYPGQEVIARVHTYGEAPWQLCRLELERELPGAELQDEAGKPAGTITSCSGRAGLGRLRRRYAREGVRLDALRGGERAAARVHLPPQRLG